MGSLGLRRCKDLKVSSRRTKEGVWKLGKSSIPPEFAKWGFCLPIFPKESVLLPLDQ